MTDHTDELAGLPEDVHEAVGALAALFSFGPDSPDSEYFRTIRAELLRLALENAELRENERTAIQRIAQSRESSEHAEAELAALKDKYQQADGMAACMAMVRDECVKAGVFLETLAPMFYPEAIIGMHGELAALKRKIAEARTITPDVGEDGDYVNVWFSGDENRHTFALLPVGGE
ncbi:MAG: hypothetical protein ACTHJP_05210 [Rhodanobacteraceae bacterium]